MTTRFAPTLFETVDTKDAAGSLARVLGFWRIYLGSVAVAYRQWQAFERLNAMSEHELLELGLTRDRILEHVLDETEATPR